MSSGERRSRLAWRCAAIAVAAALYATAGAALDLSQLQVTPQRGQSADQARRDRYECHNWAVQQSGEVPSATPGPSQDAVNAARRADRVARIATGAAIGATIGSIFGGGHDYGEDILKGAAVGSVVGVATGAAHDKKQQKQAGPEPGSDYLRALSACLEGRGYTVAMPGPAPANAVAQR
jgi:hypothetical protein